MSVSARTRRMARILLRDPRFFAAQAGRRLRRAAMLDYRLRRDGAAFAPAVVTFEVTHRCNLRCYMCDLYGTAAPVDTMRSTGDRAEDILDEHADRRLMDSIAPYRPVISLTGGEPLVVERGVRLMRLARERALAVTLTTNATLLSRCAPEVAATADVVTVSIDGAEAVHDDIRGVPGAFERAAAGVAALRAARGSRRLPAIEINATICGKNFDRLSELLPVARDFGAERVVFSHLWFWHPLQVDLHNRRFGRGAPCAVQNVAALEGLDPQGLSDEVARVKAAAGRLDVKFLPEIDPAQIAVYYGDPLAPVKRRRCIAPWLNVRILPGGDVIPCLDVKAGNVRETGFAQIWNGPVMRDFRRLVRTVGVMPGCLRCCKLFSF